MATITTTDRSTEAEGDQRVILSGVGWEGYRALLRLKGDRRCPRVIYLDGSVILVSPSPSHENMSRLLGLFVFVLSEELDVPCISTRSTTFRRRSRRGGVEPDESFYFGNRDRIRGKKRISLRTDPPPDLAVEVVVSHGAGRAIEVYRRFGVPEVWVCDRSRLTILRLGDDGRYAEAERSLAFRVLAASEIHPWVTRDQDDSDQAWARELRRWVAEVLVPRRREPATNAEPPAPVDPPENQES